MGQGADHNEYMYVQLLIPLDLLCKTRDLNLDTSYGGLE